MINQPNARNHQSRKSGGQYQPKAPFRRSLGSILATLAVILTAITLTNCAGYTSAASTGPTGSDPGTGILSASATTLSFGSVAVGSTAAQSLSVTNTGTEAVNISQVTISGSGFTVMSGNGAATLAVGQSASVQIQFAPTSAATAASNLIISSNASNSTLTIALSGTGTQGGVSVTPSSVSFGSVPDGTTATQPITLKNTGTANLNVSSESVTGTGFGVTGFSAVTLAPGNTMTFHATFAPTSTASVSGSISIVSDASSSPTTVALSGTGTSPGMSVTPSSVSFGNLPDGTTGTQIITLKNTGTGNLVVSSESVTGTGFSVTGFAAQTLAPNASMTFNAVFSPTADGSASGSISVGTNLPSSPTTIPLSGTGTQAGISITPSSVAFGSVADGASGTQPITLKNTGTANLVVSSESVIGAGFSVTGFVAQTLTPNASMTFNAVFSPTTPGAVSGSISVSTNLSGSPTAIALTGTGTQPAMSVTPSSVSFGTVTDGTGSTQAITLKNTGNANLVVSSESVTGTGFSVVNFTAQTLTPGSSMGFNAVFSPTSPGAVSGSISVSTNLTGSPTAIALTGTGANPAMSITPSSVAFGSVVDGTNNSQTITVKNTGTVNLVVSSQSVTGTGFSVTGFTAQTVTPNNTMAFNAVFAPTTVGSVTGNISLSTNVPGSPTAIGLSGTGAAGTFLLGASPTTLSFGNVNVGNNSVLGVTLKNNGNSNITVSGISGATGGFSTSGVGAGTILTPNQSATLNVTFTPTASGPASATITINSNSTTTPSISVSGTGGGAAPSVSLSWAPSSSSDVIGYNVYRGTISGGPYTKLTASPINSLLDSDSNVSSGQTYYYVVTAVDSSNDESADSNQATASIP
jgi:Cep192 domain 4/Abnormal spindle-like microcephaly-assoc'd, ASPM-SPD-2-Hydin/HYDIN/CFA65/VesB-like, Ig-like domain